MHLMYFTEQPMSAYDAKEGLKYGATALTFSNKHFDPVAGSRLYNEYIEQYLLAEEVGVDGIMLNEHHNAPFCMQAKCNVFASILAATTRRVKLVLLGNPLPLAEDPLRLRGAQVVHEGLCRLRVLALVHDCDRVLDQDRLVGHHVVAQLDPGKAAHRLAVVDRVLGVFAVSRIESAAGKHIRPGHERNLVVATHHQHIETIRTVGVAHDDHGRRGPKCGNAHAIRISSTRDYS